MRLCTIMSGGKPVVGVKIADGKIIDLSKQMPRGPKSVVEILAGGKKLQAAVAKACAKPKAGATVSAAGSGRGRAQPKTTIAQAVSATAGKTGLVFMRASIAATSSHVFRNPPTGQTESFQRRMRG